MNLHNIVIPVEELNRRKREMSHWNAVAKKLYMSSDLEEILKILVTEVNGLNRPYIVRRVYAHYNSVRRKIELAHVAEYIRVIRKLSPRSYLADETSEREGVGEGD